MSPQEGHGVRTVSRVESVECPVCYENKVACQFTCGHGFCKDCTKMWYMKGKCSCPMCRAPMCFRGIIEAKKAWHREKWDEVYFDTVAEIFEKLGEEYRDVLLQCLEAVQNRFEYVTLKYPKLNRDELHFVLCVTWIDVDYLMNVPRKKIYEPRTFEKYIFIPKSPLSLVVSYLKLSSKPMDEIINELRELRQIIQGLQLRDTPVPCTACRGVTGRGTPCRNKAAPDTEFCRMHGERPTKPAKVPRTKKPKKVQPEHVHAEGVACPLCEMHGDVLDPGLPMEDFEGVSGTEGCKEL